MTLYETYNKPLFHAKRGGVCIQSLLKQCYDSDDDDPVEPTTRLVVISYVRQRRNDRQQDQQKHRSRQNRSEQARTAQFERRPADGARSGVHDGIAFALGSLRTKCRNFPVNFLKILEFLVHLSGFFKNFSTFRKIYRKFLVHSGENVGIFSKIQ